MLCPSDWQPCRKMEKISHAAAKRPRRQQRCGVALSGMAGEHIAARRTGGAVIDECHKSDSAGRFAQDSC
jgi:hypothetical protein